ncbi:hypothetical protein D8674_023488 [Pyrus ussuriensis x Pyrus communis]|uniref:Uncharacterized protein n=1 Tax=Pyrus ussuriensis x Pyrus communis TaxID=2448454 RepID=A0A5N5H096_9ROSA|nr:hypothetical protein D8674_023488 [Pyrus ussuriensis x Pyrus communis]
MEDPSGESELEEDSPEGNYGKVRWILNKGWGLGLKILVTGMVISSAPIVLPPLVVISAIGFAVSVPSGVVLASYACTEKIMSKLLPYGEPPLLSETNGTLMSNNEEFEQDEEWEQDTWVGEKTDIEKEEGWDWRDRLEGGKMRVEFVDEETGDIIEEDAQGNVTEDVNEIVEENGYEEDVDDSTDEEEELILDSIYEVKIKGLSEDFKDDSVLDENQVDEVCGLVFNVVEGDVQMGVIPIERVNDMVEEAELVEETRGLLKKIWDEGNTDNAMEMDKQYVAENEGGGELINQKIARIADIGSQESTNTREGGVADIPDECEGMQGFQEMRFANDAKTVYEDVKPVRDIGSVSESKNAENDLAAEKPIVETKNVNDVLVEEKSRAKTRNLKPLASSFTEDKQKLVINKEEIVQGRRTDDTINELEFQLIREKEIVVSNADAREIADESGLHLFDEKNELVSKTGMLLMEFLNLPVSNIARESTNSGISSRNDVTMPSNGVLYDETKIWVKIDAIRSIVGYKGTRHATCIEELKALYLFTGVEPPTVSFSNPPDLAQVNHKLRFLMSIIGVKLDS